MIKRCRRQFFYIMISCATVMAYVILHYAYGYYITQSLQYRGETDRDKEQYVNSMPCEAVMKDFNISKYSYIMAMSYREQLMMATDSLGALVNLARGLQSRVVTPFTHNSELYGLPSTDDFPSIVGMTPSINQGPTKPLNIIYDMKQLNSDLFCDKYRLPPLAPFNEFIQYAANRRIIVIHTNVPSKSKLFPHGETYMNCGHYHPIKKFTSRLLQHLNVEVEKQKSLPFQFDSACCIPYNNTEIKSPLEIAEGCGFSLSTNISIVFTVWTGYYIKGRGPVSRLVVADTPIFSAEPSSGTDVFPLSQGIINNASAFANDLSCSDNMVEFVAVHFRTGKIQAIGLDKPQKMFDDCFNETLVLLNDLKKNCSPQQNCVAKCLRYFVDYGEFGSHSYRISGGQKISKKGFEQNNIKPVHYDPRKYGGLQDQGFVASVEQLTIAHSSILILVGGHGGFQNQLLAKFKEIGHGTKVYRVCDQSNLVNVELHRKLVYNRVQ